MSKPIRSIVLLAVGLLAACALVVVLGLRQIASNKAYAELRRLATEPHRGYAVPTFMAKTIAGDTVTVGESLDSTSRQVSSY